MIFITPVKLPSSNIEGVLNFYHDKKVMVEPLSLRSWDAISVWAFQRERLKTLLPDGRGFLAISADTDQFFEPVDAWREKDELIVFERLNFLASQTPTVENLAGIGLIPLDKSQSSSLHAITDYVGGFVNRLEHPDIFMTGHYKGPPGALKSQPRHYVEYHLRLRGIQQFIQKIKSLSFDSLEGPVSRHFKNWVNILRCQGEKGLIREYEHLSSGSGRSNSPELERFRSMALNANSHSIRNGTTITQRKNEPISKGQAKGQEQNINLQRHLPRLLVFNCHEAWVYQLGGLPFDLEIIVGLKGRVKASWDEQMRPVPSNARLVKVADVLRPPRQYHCIIAHNITDLLDVKSVPGPRILVLHSTIEGRWTEEGSDISPENFAAMVRDYVRFSRTHVVACSELKARSWGITDDILVSSVEVSAYPPHSGKTPEGLRICNHINSRRKILCWDFHNKAFGGLPVTLVGHHPDIPGVSAARNWGELKEILQRHRFYIHTADPIYEDGFNMATMEAMAAGLPVLGNRHPTSPVTDGIDGYLSDDPDELRARAEELIADPKLAHRMGQAAREKAIKLFSRHRFQDGLIRSIDIARAKWSGVTGNSSA